ncbi:protein mono-ADP-ribosyltransferase PARP14-like isoform X3 [Dreissena polymorpha]|uniref:protein mono-ADP-ribosyltransferase PARP14-like isoform X3 n=1 Tax=Dreissena polymorpha TaxID=45954 RepID=UPI0022653D54|nr:protein mono-ADP-ribosyltransferase PARP14-like isoform X3 [Dreissena polymorpha]
MGALKETWFTLQGRRPVQTELIDSTATSTEDQPAVNNNVVIKLDNSLFWTRRPLKPKRWTNRGGEIHGDLPIQTDEYSHGLPFKIHVTERTTLHIVTGDVTQQQVDVIVNVCDSYPTKSGRLSTDIIRAGNIMQEWTNLGRLEFGEVKSTGAGKGSLRSKCVYHVIGPSKECDFVTNLKTIADIVRDCLEKTVQDGYTSTVFPVLNQGRLRADKVAEAMVKAVVQFCNKPHENISDILIVIYYTDKFTENVFEQTIPTLLQIAMPTEANESNLPVVGRRTAVYVERNTLEHTDADDIAVFKIVAKGNIQQIMTQIKDCIEVEIPSEEFTPDQPLSVKEESCLKTLEKKHIVDVDIDKNTKRILVTGLRRNVERCKLEVMQLLFKDFPLWRYREKLMESVAHSVQWYYEEGGVKKEHDRASNFELQYGFTVGKDFTYTCNGVRFRVDLQSQIECPEENPGQYRQLYQRFLALQRIEIPENWSIAWSQETDQARVQLSPSDQEYIDVKVKILKDGLQPNTIINARSTHFFFLLIPLLITKCLALRK